MFCDKCGNSLTDNAIFCDKCGNKVNQEVQPEYNEVNVPEEKGEIPNPVTATATATGYNPNPQPVYKPTLSNKANTKLGALVLTTCILFLVLLGPIFGMNVEGMRDEQELGVEIVTSVVTNVNLAKIIAVGFDDFAEVADMDFDSSGETAIISFFIILFLILAVVTIVFALIGIITAVKNKTAKDNKFIFLAAIMAIAYFAVALIISFVLNGFIDDMSYGMVKMSIMPSLYTFAIGIAGVVTLVASKK